MTRFFALLWLCLTLALPLGAQENQRRFVTVEDARIYVEVMEVLRLLDPGHRVSVEVRDGRLSLSGTLTDPAALEALDARLARIDGLRQLDAELTLTNDLSDRLAPFARRMRAQLDWLIDALPLIGVALGGWAAIGWLGYVLAARRWPWDRIAPNPFIGDLVRTIVRLVAVVVGAVVALDILGASALLGTLLGAAGILGLAVGFAVRDVVENFLASVLLSLRSPFRPDDLIEVAGDTGRVVRLTARATVLISPDGNHIRIPNATVFKARIINYTRHPERRFTFTLPVPAAADLTRAIEAARSALDALPFVLPHPAATAWLDRIETEIAHIACAGWIDSRSTGFHPARGEAQSRVLAALGAAGVAMPGIAAPGASAAPSASPSAATLTPDDAIETIAEGDRTIADNENLIGTRTRDE